MQDKASTRVLLTLSNRKLALSFIQPQAAQSSSLRNMAFAITRVVLRASRFTSHLRSRSWGRHATLRHTFFAKNKLFFIYSFTISQSTKNSSKDFSNTFPFDIETVCGYRCHFQFRPYTEGIPRKTTSHLNNYCLRSFNTKTGADVELA